MKKATYHQQYRRYHLHRHIKKFAKLSVKERRIVITESDFCALPLKKQKWLREIRDKYNYSLQTEIPA